MPKKLHLNDRDVVAFALEHSVAEAAVHFGCSESYVYKRTKAFKDSVSNVPYWIGNSSSDYLSTLLIAMTPQEIEEFKHENEPENAIVKLLKEAQVPTVQNGDSFDGCLKTINEMEERKDKMLEVVKMIIAEFNSLVTVQLELEAKMHSVCKEESLKFAIGSVITDQMIKEYVKKAIIEARESK
jgi:hypothetical protein